MFRFTKKRIVALGAVASLAVAGAAFAYFTDSGSGSGTAGVGSSAGYTVAVTTGTQALFPAGPTNSVHVLVTNNGHGAQRISSLVPTTVTADKAGCVTAFSSGGSNDPTKDFYIAPITVPANTTLAPAGSAGNTYATDTTVQMNDTGVSQDNCQGATLTITYHVA
jgi:hypothetical protein